MEHEIDKSGQHLTTLKGITEKLRSGALIYLNNNQLTDLKGMPDNLPELKKIKLHDNPIKTFAGVKKPALFQILMCMDADELQSLSLINIEYGLLMDLIKNPLATEPFERLADYYGNQENKTYQCILCNAYCNLQDMVDFEETVIANMPLEFKKKYEVETQHPEKGVNYFHSNGLKTRISNLCVGCAMDTVEKIGYNIPE